MLTKNLTDILSDAINLAIYAVEIGRLPATVSFSDLYRMWEHKVEKGQRLSEQDVDKLQFYYQALEVELSPVSAVSLRATDTSGRNNDIKTEAGKHARRMWLIAFSILGLIITINLYRYTFDMFSGDWAINDQESFGSLTLLYWLAGSLTPFAYGAFGAAVRLLRITEKRLRERSFDPRRIVEHRNRLVLGTLSGGVIVLIFSTGGVGETDINLTEAALGFLAGYSIDLMFSLLDRMVKAISPSDEDCSAAVLKAGKTPLNNSQQSFEKREIEKAKSVVNTTDENDESKHQR